MIKLTPESLITESQKLDLPKINVNDSDYDYEKEENKENTKVTFKNPIVKQDERFPDSNILQMI
jgi:hypothetical protein